MAELPGRICGVSQSHPLHVAGDGTLFPFTYTQVDYQEVSKHLKQKSRPLSAACATVSFLIA